MDSNNLKQFDRAKANDGGSNPNFRKIRVVAKVRGFSDPEEEVLSDSSKSPDWISVTESSEGVAISFSSKESCLVDYCYGNKEENEIIHSRDVKPLISAVFEGHNSTVIAIGAKGSGKTHVIQGSTETPGLSVLAITEFLSVAEKSGTSVAVSFYEVDHQEHVVDLLNPEQPTVSVYEGRGRMQFKGLSQIIVKSIAEFQKLCFTATAVPKAAVKNGNDRACRSHVGLIVHVITDVVGPETGYVGKMNFVDLAGYEGGRRKSSDNSSLAESNKINNSIYALLKVCHALSNNENHVPYRESKLTRMLQDTLRGTSRILMVFCMKPSFCQDTIYMASLVSRSCQGNHRATLDSTKKTGNCSARLMLPTSSKSQMLKSVSSAAKKLTGSRSQISEKKTTGVKKSAIKGRKLFDEANHSVKAEKATLSDATTTFKTSVLEDLKEDSIAHVTKASVPSSLDNSVPDDGFHIEPKSMEENDDSVSDSVYQAESVVEKVVVEESDDHQKEVTPISDNFSKSLSIIDSTVKEGHNMNKENDSFFANNTNGPPLLSDEISQLSNKMKSVLMSIPLRTVKLPSEQECISLDYNQVSTDIVEPKTPVTEQTLRVNDRCDVMNTKSPWETYSVRNSGMKNSLVQDYLKLLNTANKEELKKLKGIGEKRATYILELREESPEPFKSLDDLKDIGLSAKQIKGMMKKEAGSLFN